MAEDISALYRVHPVAPCQPRSQREATELRRNLKLRKKQKHQRESENEGATLPDAKPNPEGDPGHAPCDGHLADFEV